MKPLMAWTLRPSLYGTPPTINRQTAWRIDFYQYRQLSHKPAGVLPVERPVGATFLMFKSISGNIVPGLLPAHAAQPHRQVHTVGGTFRGLISPQPSGGI